MSPETKARLESAKRLFVDVDDTLIYHITSQRKDLIFVIEGYEPNSHIQDVIRDWVFTGSGVTWHRTNKPIVIWSGGGADWAQQMWQFAVGGLTPFANVTFMAKFNIKPQEGDLFIDDDPLPAFASATIHPREFM